MGHVWRQFVNFRILRNKEACVKRDKAGNPASCVKIRYSQIFNY